MRWAATCRTSQPIAVCQRRVWRSSYSNQHSVQNLLVTAAPIYCHSKHMHTRCTVPANNMSSLSGTSRKRSVNERLKEHTPQWESARNSTLLEPHLMGRLQTGPRKSTQPYKMVWWGQKINGLGQSRPSKIDPKLHLEFRISDTQVCPKGAFELQQTESCLTGFMLYQLWSSLELLISENGNGNIGSLKSTKHTRVGHKIKLLKWAEPSHARPKVTGQNNSGPLHQSGLNHYHSVMAALKKYGKMTIGL